MPVSPTVPVARTRRRRLLALGVIAVVGIVGIALVLGSPGRRFAERRLARVIAANLGGTATVRIVELDVLPPRVRATVQAAGGSTGLQLGEIAIDGGWGSLTRSPPVVDRVVITGLALTIDRTQPGDAVAIDLGALLDAVRIEQLTASAVSVTVLGADGATEVTDAALELTLADDGYAGRFQIDALRLGLDPSPYRVAGRLAIGRSGIAVDALDLTGDGLVADGALGLSGESLGDFSWEGSATLAASWMARVIPQAPPSGGLRVTGRVAIPATGPIELGLGLAADWLRVAGLQTGPAALAVAGTTSDLKLSDVQIELPGAQLSGGGRLVPEGEGSVARLALQIGDLPTLLGALDLPLAGLGGSGRVDLDVRAAALTAAAVAGGVDVALGGLVHPAVAWNPADLTARLELADGALSIVAATLRSGAAELTAQGRIEADGAPRVQFELRDLDLAEVLAVAGRELDDPSRLADFADLAGTVGLVGELEGGPGGSALQVQAKLSLGDLRRPGSDRSVAVDADLVADLDRGLQGLGSDRIQVTAPGLSLSVTGRLDPTTVAIDLRGDVDAAGASAVAQVLGASVAPDSWSAIDGRLGIDGQLGGSWSELSGGVRLIGQDLALYGEPLSVFVDGAGDAGRWQLAARVSSDGGGIDVDGIVDPDCAELRATVREQRVEALLGPLLAARNLPVEGDLAAELVWRWPEGAADVVVDVRNGLLFGVALDRLEAAATIGDGLEIDRLVIAMAGGVVEARGWLDSGWLDSGQLDTNLVLYRPSSGITLMAAGLELGALRPIVGDTVARAVSGVLGVHGRIDGPWTAPRLSADIEVLELCTGDRSTPPIAGNLLYDGGALAMHLAPDGVDAAVSARIAAGDVAIQVASWPLLIDAARLGEATAGSLEVSGRIDAQLTVPSAAGGLSTGAVEVADLTVDTGRRVWRTSAPVRLELEPERLRVPSLILEAGTDRLDATGEIARVGDQQLQMRVHGDLDLYLLRGLDQELRSDGLAAVDVILEGPLADPEWRGSLTVRDGRLAHPAVPVQLANLELQLTAAANRISIDRLAAVAGGGAVEVTGELVLAGTELVDYRLDIVADGLRMEMPFGVRTESTSRLQLVRAATGQPRLQGRIDLTRGVMRSEFEAAAGVRPGGAAAAQPGVLDRLELDLDLRADDTVWIRNALVTTPVSVGLRVGGDVGRPELTGRVATLDGGKLRFRRVEYGIERGFIDFLSGWPITSKADIRASATIGDYVVRLQATGPVDGLGFELSSDPPLPQEDVVSLLLLGRTRTQLYGEGGINRAEVAAYLTEPLAGRLASSVESSLGLDEVRIEPLAVAGQVRPSARVTVSKQIGPNLRAVYSSDLSRDREDLYQLRQKLTRNLSVVVTRDRDESLSGEVRFKRGDVRRLDRTDRPKIAAVTITGARALAPQRVRKLLGLGVGDRLAPEKLVAGMDELRQAYIVAGRPEVEVDRSTDVDAATGEVRLTIDIVEGRRVQLTAVGFELNKRLRREILQAWAQSVFRDEEVDRIERLVADDYRQRGYLDATARGQLVRSDDERVELSLELRSGERFQVGAVRLEGAPRDRAAALGALLTVKPAGAWGRRWVSPLRIDDDVALLTTDLVAAGYIAARVGSRLDRATDGRPRAEVAYVIEPGPLHRTAAIEIRLLDAAAASETEPTGAALAAMTGLTEGAPYGGDPQLQAALTRIRQHYDRAGFVDATVEGRVQVGGAVGTIEPSDDVPVNVAFEVRPGPRITIDGIAIDGAVHTRKRAILDRLALQVGQPASDERLAKARYDLYRTGLFRSVDVRREAAVGTVVIAVDEVAPTQFDVGLGYNSDTGPLVSAELSHRSLFGRMLQGTAGGNWSPDGWLGGGALTQPQLFGAIDGLVWGYYAHELRESFERDHLGTGVQLMRAAKALRLQAGYDLERSTVRATGTDATESDRFRLGRLRVGLLSDLRDNVFWPKRGNLFRLDLSLQARQLLSDREFVRGYAQAARVQPLGATTLAVSARLGAASPFGGTERLPLSERFFTGGETSLRGFATDTVAPHGLPEDLADDDTSPGGGGLLLLNAQVIRRLKGFVHATAFLDAGDLSWTVRDLLGDGLDASAGLGLWLETPIGPARIEHAWRLQAEPGQATSRWHFSLGLPF